MRIKAGTAIALAWVLAAAVPVYSGSNTPRQFVVSRSFGPSADLVPVIAGVPFECERTIETTYALSGGRTFRLVLKQGRMYRDSQGRLRYDEPVAPGDAAGPILIRIVDAPGGVEYILDTQRHVAHRLRLPLAAEGQESPAAGEGVVMSSQLGLAVVQKVRDPHVGEIVRRLENVHRAEPDAALFQLPADYLVVEESAGFSIRFTISREPDAASGPFAAGGSPALKP